MSGNTRDIEDGFLQRALDLTFFPELFAVRTEIEA